MQQKFQIDINELMKFSFHLYGIGGGEFIDAKSLYLVLDLEPNCFLYGFMLISVFFEQWLKSKFGEKFQIFQASKGNFLR